MRTGWVLQTSPSDHYWWRYLIRQFFSPANSHGNCCCCMGVWLSFLCDGTGANSNGMPLSSLTETMLGVLFLHSREVGIVTREVYNTQMGGQWSNIVFCIIMTWWHVPLWWAKMEGWLIRVWIDSLTFWLTRGGSILDEWQPSWP